jgi:uncharacterized alkaline shock family protein YloU
VEGHARISPDIVARYAGDAAREVPGVVGLVESALARHAGVRVSGDRERPEIVVHLAVAWETPLQALGREVQRRIADFLGRMADVHPASIDVVVESIGGA